MGAECAFIKLSECEKLVSYFAEDYGKFTLRLYDVSGKDETVEVTLPRDVAQVNYVNLLGEELSPCEAAGCGFKVHCPPHKIVTVEFTLK